ncbi:hypothetical protein Kisp02_56100 [Kineosporia sp. NBRC 101731]|nr:hypothetical protein Kisp02_56100 [Kineosporia sp. NBRC 101731]
MPLDRVGASGIFGDPRTAIAATGQAIFDDLDTRSAVLPEAFCARLGLALTIKEKRQC